MKFIRFMTKENLISYGILEGNKVCEIEGSIYSNFSKTGNNYNVEDVKLLAPCVPGKIICIGLNYKDHIKELNYETPTKPANFMKPNSSVIGTEEKIMIPAIAEQVDYEGELAVVIKDQIKEVEPEDAAKHILGVTPLNDITERKISSTPSLVTYSKGFDTFTAFGPIIDTDIDPDNATVRTFLNGEKVQEGYTNNMVFNPSMIVSFISKGITLYPGDLISTGTPFGIRPMQDGDKVEVEIEDLGMRLVNYVYDPRKH